MAALPLRLRAETLQQIDEHAVAEYDSECCGLVFEDGKGVQHVCRIRNIQDRMHADDPDNYPRTAQTAYCGDPADLLAALTAAGKPGCRLLAFYHSHPDHEAYFSEEDVVQATPMGEPSYPEAAQIVVSVQGDRVAATKIFVWQDEAGTYVDASFEVT